MSNKKNIVFIGGGNMAEAILKGGLAADTFKAEQLTVTDIKNERLNYLEKEYGVKTSSKNIVPVDAADIVIFAVKPQSYAEVLKEIGSVLNDQKIIVSIMAGVTIAQLQKDPGWKVVRAMPNTPALISEGISALCKSSSVTEQEKETVDNIFKAIGKVLWVEEDMINSVTALSGSGPAFVYRLIDHFMQSGKGLGLTEEAAWKLTLQTFIGATRMVEVSGLTPDELVQKVASPNGTTVAGLNVLDNSNVQKEIEETIKAAKKRADELSKE
jgi:pyrroline-5-carboxylate reductase